MNKKPFISFVVPAYNAETTICKCVESILNILEVPVEVIVADDGSTDGTADTLRKISDERLHLISQKNHGVSAARNRGMLETQGDFVAFCDADDMIIAQQIHHVISVMQSDDELVMYSAKRGNERSGYQPDLPILENGLYGKKGLEELRKRILDVPLYQHWENHIMQGSVCRYLFQKKILTLHHIQFREELSYAEDLCFMVEVFNKFSSIRIVNSHAYIVNVSLGSASRKYRPDFWQENINRYQAIEEILGTPQDILFCYDGRSSITHYLLWAKFFDAKRRIAEILSNKRFTSILSGIQFSDRTRGERFFDWCVLQKHPILLWYYYAPSRIRFRLGRLMTSIKNLRNKTQVH